MESSSVYGHLLIVSHIRYYIYRLWQRECQSYSQWKRFWTLNYTVSRNIPIIIAVVRFAINFIELNTTLIIDWYADSIGSNSCRLVSRTFNMILCHWCRRGYASAIGYREWTAIVVYISRAEIVYLLGSVAYLWVPGLVRFAEAHRSFLHPDSVEDHTWEDFVIEKDFSVRVLISYEGLSYYNSKFHI